MNNAELNKLSLTELRDLNRRVKEMYSLKLKMEGMVNGETLKPGITVRYIGNSSKIKEDIFIVKKINKVNAVCENKRNGTLWNINLANIEECEAEKK